MATKRKFTRLTAREQLAPWAHDLPRWLIITIGHCMFPFILIYGMWLGVKGAVKDYGTMMDALRAVDRDDR